MPDTPADVARQMWRLLEPLHAVLYYAPEINAQAADLGYAVDTRWPSYFAWRAAPLGPAGPALVSATFYSFSPRMVARHVPGAWRTSDPATVLDHRLCGIDRALHTLLGARLTGPEVAEAADLARRAAEAADTAGRPLAAANADLPWPEQPHLMLWQAATILREHRGDGHVAALLTADLDPCEALVSLAAVGAAPVQTFAGRGWSTDEWAQAAARLAARGWLQDDGSATARGVEGRAAVERRTDELAGGPWRALGPGVARLAQLVAPLVQSIVASGLLPRQSTLGMGRPPS